MGSRRKSVPKPQQTGRRRLSSFTPPPQLKSDAGGAEPGQGDESRLRLNPIHPTNAAGPRQALPVLCPLSQRLLAPSPSSTTGWRLLQPLQRRHSGFRTSPRHHCPAVVPPPCQSRATALCRGHPEPHQHQAESTFPKGSGQGLRPRAGSMQDLLALEASALASLGIK